MPHERFFCVLRFSASNAGSLLFPAPVVFSRFEFSPLASIEGAKNSGKRTQKKALKTMNPLIPGLGI
jgi:hypothetical protein